MQVGGGCLRKSCAVEGAKLFGFIERMWAKYTLGEGRGDEVQVGISMRVGASNETYPGHVLNISLPALGPQPYMQDPNYPRAPSASGCRVGPVIACYLT